MWTTLNFRDRGKLKKKRLEIFMYIRTLYIEFERDWSIGLGHGCAKVAHCVTARWRNFSHYCRPVCHYDVWLCVLITAKHRQARWQHTVYRNKRLEFATEQVGKLRYVTAVDGGLKRFPWVAWFAHPWFRLYFRRRSHRHTHTHTHTLFLNHFFKMWEWYRIEIHKKNQSRIFWRLQYCLHS